MKNESSFVRIQFISVKIYYISDSIFSISVKNNSISVKTKSILFELIFGQTWLDFEKMNILESFLAPSVIFTFRFL